MKRRYNDKQSFGQIVALIVEPVGTMREALVSMLNALSFAKVISARDGQEALSVIERGQIGLVISDFHVPKINAIDMLKHVRSEPQTSQIPFIIISATIEQSEVVRAVKSGVSEYVVKPFSLNMLRERLLSSIANPIKATAKVDKKPKASANNPVVKKPSILIVDDVADNIHIIADLLRADYQIKAALNGEKALKICQSVSPPDLVLLDIMMPEMDGMEVCRRIKTNPATAHIAVIFLSAVDQSSKIVEGLNLGAVDYITKPIIPPVAKARVKAHIDTFINGQNMANELNVLIENVQLRDKFNRLLQQDLKTPLIEIQQQIVGLKRISKKPDLIESAALELTGYCNSLYRQIDNMTTVSQIEEGCYDYCPEKISLREITKQVISDVVPAIKRKKLEIKQHLPQECPVKVEDTLLSTIIYNLLQNAIDEAPIGSAIEVNTHNTDEMVQLDITNIGMVADEIRESLFDKYISYGKKDASGLGTYVAKLMATLQMGNLTYTSVQGKTCFSLKLPRSK